jgi:antitoxin (DNA-binding transcriptional repressor) of toxin-antitoxin stability system
MKTITATELARNLSRVLDQLSAEGGELVIERNARAIAYMKAAPAEMNAIEAMADLYRTLSGDAAERWEAESRSRKFRGATLRKGVRDPWAS